jgi:hypothetical protein
MQLPLSWNPLTLPAPPFVINGLKREELIASNSMILHELYFDGVGSQGEPDKELSDALIRDFGRWERWQPVCRHGQSAWRRIWMGIADVFASRQETRQPMGCRPYLLFGRSRSHPCFGHVRTFLSHGLWCQGSSIRRCFYEQHQLGECLAHSP